MNQQIHENKPKLSDTELQGVEMHIRHLRRENVVAAFPETHSTPSLEHSNDQKENPTSCFIAAKIIRYIFSCFKALCPNALVTFRKKTIVAVQKK